MTGVVACTLLSPGGRSDQALQHPCLRRRREARIRAERSPPVRPLWSGTLPARREGRRERSQNEVLRAACQR
jgi:hypothetical protein